MPTPLPASLFRAPALSPADTITLCLKAQGGDLKARNKVVEANLRLVASIAKGDADAFQAGALGLARAVETFDGGSQFGSWAGLWIRAEIQKAQASDAVVRGPGTQAARWVRTNIARASAAIAGLGQEPTSERIAAHLGVAVDLVDAIRVARVASLDARKGEDGGSLGDTLADPSGSPEAVLADAADAADASEKAARLRAIAQAKGLAWTLIFDLRLCASSDEAATLQDVADALGCSRENVRQQEAKLLAALRKAV